MTLLVDIGNSRIKWCKIDSPQQVMAVQHNGDWSASCDICFAESEPDAEIYISCVAGASARQELAGWLWDKWHSKPVFVDSQRECDGLQNSYDTPAALGVDRWLAMLAAWHKSRRAFCLFDFGTALTVDMVNNNGRHQGGWIVAGRAMQLHSFAAVPTVGAHLGPLPGWDSAAGSSSITALQSGTALSLLAVVQYVVAFCQSRYGGDMDFYCCGGDMPEPKIMPPAPWQYEPHLVLHGLAKFAVLVS